MLWVRIMHLTLQHTQFYQQASQADTHEIEFPGCQVIIILAYSQSHLICE